MRLLSWALIFSWAAGAIEAQSSDEDLIKAKKAAERAQQRIALPATPAASNPNEAIEQKRSAEATYSLIAGVGGAARLVKYKPYSAEADTETVQILADGNRIVRHNATKLYRDAAGRTRREQTIEALGPSSPIPTGKIVVISDPVASVDFILDDSRKLARKFVHLEDVAPRSDGGNQPDGIHLGTRTVEGLDCTGSRRVTTIPAGAIGNLRPIVTVTETWYSSTIEELVRSTTSDPRFGDTSYTLRNIVLAEPSPEMFRPPSGYQVQFESPAGAVMKRSQ